jgi:hypothetical protein
MANTNFSAYRAGVVVLAGGNSEMNSLANNNVGAVTGTGTGVVLDNSTNKDLLCDFEFNSGTFGSAPTAGGTVELHMYASLDGTNYETSLATGATLPNDLPIGLFIINGTATTQRRSILGVRLSPGKYKFAVVNKSGQAFPATLATVTAYTYYVTTA